MNKRNGLFALAVLALASCSTGGNSSTDNNPLAGVTIIQPTPTPVATPTPVPTPTPTPAPMATQAIADSGFETEGMAGNVFSSWSKCSYAHAGAAPGSSPLPAVTASAVTADIVSESDPSFDVGPTPAAPAASPTPYAVVTSAPHGGTYAALVYAGTEANTTVFPPNAAAMASTKAGVEGICQTFVVPANASLMLYVNEGGSDTNSTTNTYFDQEADVFAGSDTTGTAINVFSDADTESPNGPGYVPGYQVKGPYALNAAPYNLAAGSTATLFVGAFESSASKFYGAYMLVDDVTVTGTVAPASAARRGANATRVR